MTGAATAVVVGGGLYATGATLATAAAVGLGAGAVASQIKQGQDMLKQAERSQAEQASIQRQALAQQKTAQAEASAAAQTQAKAAEQTMNAANRKSPDVSGIVAAAESLQQGGIGSTMLTGPTGVDPNDLKLGKSTLLGA